MGDILNRFQENTEETKIVDADRKLRIGIIGTGWIAEAHIAAYKHYADAEIVAAADIIPGKAAAFCKKMGLEGVKCYDGGHKEMLDDPDMKLDAVSICTYNCQHVPPAIYALEKGVHVMLEKPMCVTMDEAAELLKAEKKSGKVLSIGFQPRLDPNMQMIKKIVDSGELGKIYYIQTGAAAVAASRRPTALPSSQRIPAASAHWATSAAIRWTWCSTRSAIRSRCPFPVISPRSSAKTRTMSATACIMNMPMRSASMISPPRLSAWRATSSSTSVLPGQ